MRQLLACLAVWSIFAWPASAQEGEKPYSTDAQRGFFGLLVGVEEAKDGFWVLIDTEDRAVDRGIDGPWAFHCCEAWSLAESPNAKALRALVGKQVNVRGYEYSGQERCAPACRGEALGIWPRRKITADASPRMDPERPFILRAKIVSVEKTAKEMIYRVENAEGSRETIAAQLEVHYDLARADQPKWKKGVGTRFDFLNLAPGVEVALRAYRWLGEACVEICRAEAREVNFPGEMKFKSEDSATPQGH